MALPQQSSLSADPALEGDEARVSLRPRAGGWRLASIALFSLAWEMAGRIPINPAFPPVSETAAALVRMTVSGALPLAYLSTLQPLLLGLLVSASFGVMLGVLMGLRSTVEWFGAPVFIVLQAAPVAALIPLVTFVYGIGLLAKTIAVCLLALPVVVLNSYKAVRNVSPSLIAMGRSFLGTPAQLVRKIILPDAAPLIFAGLRLGGSAAFVGVILAELLITPTGIGDLITYHRSTAEYAEMYAAIASIIGFSALTLAGLQRVEVRLFRPEKRG
jgi:ABC-type nitrate/sulfonate/bicarbonate transport system permease component